jgi:hypothetical protein
MGARAVSMRKAVPTANSVGIGTTPAQPPSPPQLASASARQPHEMIHARRPKVSGSGFAVPGDCGPSRSWSPPHESSADATMTIEVEEGLIRKKGRLRARRLPGSLDEILTTASAPRSAFSLARRRRGDACRRAHPREGAGRDPSRDRGGGAIRRRTVPSIDCSVPMTAHVSPLGQANPV